jgi:hypothetical protein
MLSEVSELWLLEATCAAVEALKLHFFFGLGHMLSTTCSCLQLQIIIIIMIIIIIIPIITIII